MEIWLDVLDETGHIAVDATFSKKDGSDIRLTDGLLYRDGVMIGGHVHIDSEEAQTKARSLAGSVEWILLTFENWSMIPIENIVAAAESTPTKVAAQITQPIEAQGAGFALNIGVDALLCSEECLEAAQVVKSLRLENAVAITPERTARSTATQLTTMTITDVQEGLSGDRVCIDLLSMLNEGEGILIGSTSRSFALIHGETIQSKYVPTRPFRINAGSVEAYTYLADGSTKYLCEIHSGDEICIIGKSGESRTATVGRMKIETRPLILLRFQDENTNEGHVFIQQAETVRLVLESGGVCSVTDISVGDRILGCSFFSTRHVGQSISAPSKER